jgi:phospholipase C
MRMRLLSRLRRLLTPAQGKLVEAAADVTVPGSAGLSDIRHVVILMQENRSFDHYFGTMSAARGFPTRTC